MLLKKGILYRYANRTEKRLHGEKVVRPDRDMHVSGLWIAQEDAYDSDAFQDWIIRRLQRGF